MNDNELITKVITEFLKDIPQQIDELKRVIEANDMQATATLAHKLKGAAANVGGMVFNDYACKIELAGKAGEDESVKNNMRAIEKNFVQLKQAMEEYQR